LRWCAVSPEALAWRDFDGQSVVRNARTGSTHLLDDFPAEVLRLMVETGNALSAAEVAAQLDVEGASEEWETAAREVLLELERLGLLEPQNG
jgi:PqqD family protein of HPr-rel-A system